MSSNLEIVQAIYQAFGRGDVPAILSHLADDVQWESWENNYAQKAGVPWLQPRNGKETIPDFFRIVGSMQMEDFQVLSIMEGPNQVAAEILIDFIIPETGRRLRDEEIHLWTFNKAGKVVRLRHYLDTQKHLAAAGK